MLKEHRAALALMQSRQKQQSVLKSAPFCRASLRCALAGFAFFVTEMGLILIGKWEWFDRKWLGLWYLAVYSSVLGLIGCLLSGPVLSVVSLLRREGRSTAALLGLVLNLCPFLLLQLVGYIISMMLSG
jgi:hypothetical protein